MRLTRKLPVALAAVMLSASAAMAADPIFIPPPPAPAPAPIPVAYDWGGFHFGVHSGALLLYGSGVQAGFNFQRGNLVFGIEGRVGGIWGVGPPPVFYAGLGG
jgi:outer membrane immunogenic protein